MKFEIKDLEPLHSREISHYHHMYDNRDNEADYKLLVGNKNSFLIGTKNRYGLISKQFEEKLEDPLEDVLSFMKEICASVNLIGFNRDEIDKVYFTISSAQNNVSWRMYQTPLTAEQYEQKLKKKFSKTGFSYRELDKSDIPDLMNLIKTWAESKKRSAFNLHLEPNIASIESIDKTIVELQKIRSEAAWLDYSVKTQKDYEEFMDQPLSNFYGAFREGKLLAYIFTEGNKSFQTFHSRSSIRMNSTSPQEFLDYSVALEFVKKGVKVFDRGFLNIRAGMIGLIEYKKKFGKLNCQLEYDLADANVLGTPEHKYLKKLFNKNKKE